MDLKQRVAKQIAADNSLLKGLSHALYETPELAYEEFQSSDLIAKTLDARGMKVERKAHGLETAFRATTGAGSTHVVICAEYDALPEIGHACGHNIIAAAAVGAGLSLAKVAPDLGIKITVLGTPAEESGGGKIDLIKAGAFDDATVAMMVHPAPYEVVDVPTLAWCDVEVIYLGKESHASASPESGLNALDAVVQSYTAIAALRQHIRRSERIHGIITHGGDAPNIVPKRAGARYFVRARTMDELADLKKRVTRCFEGAAHATGCDLEINWRGNDYDAVVTNGELASLYESNLERLGRTAIPRKAIEAFSGSTDMGNVSKMIPSIHPFIDIRSLPAVNHQADFAAATITSDGDKAIVDGATAMAWTVIDLATIEGAPERVVESFSPTT